MFKTRRLVSDFTYMAYLGYLLNGNIEKNLNLMESTSRDTVFKDWIGHCVMFGGYPKVEKKLEIVTRYYVIKQFYCWYQTKPRFNIAVFFNLKNN